MSIRIKDPQPQWWSDREKSIRYKIMNMHTGNALHSGKMTIVYVFKRSKHPKFYIYHEDQMLFGPATNPEDVIGFLMSFSTMHRHYFDHVDVTCTENGGYEFQTFE